MHYYGNALRLIAEEMDRDKDQWPLKVQIYDPSVGFITIVECEHLSLCDVENGYGFRRVPDNMTVNGVKVPMPVQAVEQAPNTYYFPSPISSDCVDHRIFLDNQQDYNVLHNNMMHRDWESAKIHADALFGSEESSLNDEFT